MIKRWIFFTGCMLAGALVGWFAAGTEGLAVGLAVGAIAWVAADSVQLTRWLLWLRSEQINETGAVVPGNAGALRGVWREMAERTRRLLKGRDRQYQEIQTRLEEFLSAIQASPSAVVLLDADGRIEWSNHMASEHFGFDAKRDVMQHIANLVRDPAFKAYMASADFSGSLVIPGHFNTPSHPVKLSVNVHSYGQGRKLLLSSDITAVELAEAMRRDFVANVSHEIRTPLTVLAGFIETLQTLPLEEAERERYLGLMAQQSQRMQTLVHDLLTLSRLEGSPFPGAHEWSTTGALLAQCEQEARALSRLLWAGGPQQLQFDSGPACELAGVPVELYSAMSNLVSNAIRYTPETGSVQVSWNLLPDGRGEFLVRDSGPGIAPEHLPRLTERFYRVDRSRSRETGGTGLGLAIVKHVAHRHGAELLVRSHPGQGSTFGLLFPSSRVRLASVASSRLAETSV